MATKKKPAVAAKKNIKNLLSGGSGDTKRSSDLEGGGGLGKGGGGKRK